jgi:hypothetical protein
VRLKTKVAESVCGKKLNQCNSARSCVSRIRNAVATIVVAAADQLQEMRQLSNRKEEVGLPASSLMPSTTRLALASSSTRSLPKQAPSSQQHHSSLRSEKRWWAMQGSKLRHLPCESYNPF